MAQAKIGFIAAGGSGNPTGIGEYVTRLHNAGLTAVVMCNDGTVGISDALATGGNHVMLFRVVKDGSEFYSVPNYSLSPKAAAVDHWAKIKPFFHPDVIANKDRVWIQPANEPDKNRAGWLGDFGVELATLANGEGYKVAMFAWSSGEPEPNHWLEPGMIRYLEYCEANHDRAAVALHEYDLMFEGMASTYPWHIGRFEFLFQACDDLGIRRPLVLITEFGWKLDNVPSQAQVIDDLDFAGLLYSQYPNILGAGIWYLGGGFNGIANKVQPLIAPITDFILDTEYPDPPDNPDEPGEPPMPTNLLRNADFEGGWFDQPTGQVPNEWAFEFYVGANPYDPMAYVKPETRVIQKSQLPAAEWELFGLTGNQAVKAFKGSGTWHGAYIQNLSQPLTGNGKLTVRFFADLVASYSGGKTYATYDHDNPAGQLRVNGGEWQLMIPGEINTFVFELPAGTSQVKVETRYNYPLASCGIFADDWTLELIDVPVPPPPPPPPGDTFEERLWKASIIEQDTNGVVFHPVLGLWKKIKADGLDVVTHERGFEGVNYQVGEKPGGERWVYTWTAAAGIQRFKWPADGPTPGGPVIIDVIDQLATHPTKVYQSRPLAVITTLTIHHSVSGGGANPLAEVISIAQYHVNTKDWPGIGYHFCIGANGSIYVVNPITTKSFHAGSYSAPGDENYWSVGICLLGNFTAAPPPQAQLDAAKWLVAYLKTQLPTVTAVIGHKAMPGAATACPGNTSPQWLPYIGGAPLPGGIDMPPYFLPASGNYGDICILTNNWGQGSERQQLQRDGMLSYVTKNQQWERRLIANDGIYLELDTSPGNGEYYTIEGSAWLPLKWNPGQEHTRTETVEFFSKANCQPTTAPYTVTNKIKFAALHSTWTSAGGIALSNVIELQWLIAGVVEETYHFAPGKGLVSWGNRAGKKSWVTEVIPVGQQGNNVREAGCFS